MVDFNNYLSEEWVKKNHITFDKSWKNIFNKIDKTSKKIISIDGHYSINWKDFKLNLIKSISENKKIVFLNFYKNIIDYKDLNIFFKNNLLDSDPLFGKISNHNIDIILKREKKLDFKKKSREIFKNKGLYDYIIIIGTGINSIGINKYFDIKFYIDLDKISSLINSNWSNIGKTQTVSPNFYYYFIFPIMEKYRKKIINDMDYYVENTQKNKFKFLKIKSLFKILNKISQEPLKLNPIYEPGVWGGQWLVKKRKLKIKNCAIGMELIGQEQNISIKFKKNLIEIPFTFLMSFMGENILGKKNSSKFKNYFPLRVAYDDTFSNKNQNLSIQVHPNKSYIKKKFNEPISQAEMYYIADQSKQSKVFLGFKNKVSEKKFKKDVKYSEITGKKIDYKKYINSINARKEDLFLIPPGTIHAAGSGNFVLEISNTPYRYTFKIYDYCRINIDGKKRQLSLKHAFNVLNYRRDSNWVSKNLKPQPKLLTRNKNFSEYLLSDHKDFTFNLFRVHFINNYHEKITKNIHVINLVKGTMIFLINNKRKIKINLSLSETLLIPDNFGNYKIISNSNEEYQIIKIVLK